MELFENITILSLHVFSSASHHLPFKISIQIDLLRLSLRHHIKFLRNLACYLILNLHGIDDMQPSDFTYKRSRTGIFLKGRSNHRTQCG